MWEKTEACADIRILNRDLAHVEVTPPRKKVAIVGFASNTLHLVPWTDPAFEIWGLNQGAGHMQRRADRWFEMHLPEAVPDVRDPNYIAFLNGLDIPVYMIEAYDEYPTAMRYPIEDAIQYVGRDYFMSSPSFMLALAGMESFEEIHLYGINLAIGDEYTYEKPNCEWMIGLLQGRGIKIHIPMASSLLKQYRRYGYHIDARPNQNFKGLLQARINDYRSQCERIQADFHVKLGAMKESEALLHVAEGIDHGADVMLIPVPGT